MRRPATLWIPALMLLAACNDEPAAPEPPASTSALTPVELPLVDASSTITDDDAAAPAIAALLAEAFSYLPPLPQKPASGEFDATLLHELLVDVCVPDECGSNSLVQYRSTSIDGGETIRLEQENEHYHVNWSPGKLGLPSPAEYRIRVLAAGLELGHIDIELLSNGGQEQVLSDTDLTVLENRTLPVKFRVNRNPLIAAWLFSQQGGSAAEVAAMLRSSFESPATTAAEILAHLGISAPAVTTALTQAGYPVADIVAALAHAFGYGAADAAAAAFEAGLDAADAGSALIEVFGTSVEEAAGALREAGYDATAAGTWLLGLDGAAGAAHILRSAAYGINDVATFLESTGAVDVESLGAALLAAGFAMEEVAQWLLGDRGLELSVVVSTLQALGQPAENVGAWLFGVVSTEAEAVLALKDAGYDVAAIARVLVALDRTAGDAARLLREAGASAFEIGTALVGAYEQSVEQVAQLLETSGFDAAAAYDAVYRAGTEVLGNPADFALRAAFAAMNGAGYAFDDFRGAVIDGLQQWTNENVTEALGLSGYGMSDIVPFVIDVLGMTVDHVMERAHAWGVPLPDIVHALVDAGAAVDEVAAAAHAAYNAALHDLAQALLDAGATAEQVGTAAIEVYEQTLEDVAALFHEIGVGGEAAFNAVYDIGVEVLGNPADFALSIALAVMKGTGYAFDDFSAALLSPLREWTREQLIDALGISGFTLRELASWMVDVLGLTYDRVAEIGRRWGLPLDEIASALEIARAGAADIADALGFAGFTLDDIGQWLLDRSTAGADALADAAETLLDAGFPVESIADWVWRKTGHVADQAATVLRRAGLSAHQVFAWVVDHVGLGLEAAFAVLHAAGYSAAAAADAAHHTGGASLADVGEWLARHYDARAELTLSILQSLDAPLAVLIHVLAFVYAVTVDVAAGLLTAFGYSLTDVLASWP